MEPKSWNQFTVTGSEENSEDSKQRSTLWLRAFSILGVLGILATSFWYAQASGTLTPSAFRYGEPVELIGRMRTNEKSGVLYRYGIRSVEKLCYLRLTRPISLTRSLFFGSAEPRVTEVQLVEAGVPFDRLWRMAQQHSDVSLYGTPFHSVSTSRGADVYIRVSEIHKLSGGAITRKSD